MRCVMSPLSEDVYTPPAAAKESKEQFAAKQRLIEAFGFASEQVKRSVASIRDGKDDVRCC